MRLKVSWTAYQRGFGSDKWKHASGFTRAEAAAIRAGARIFFRASRPSHPTSPAGTYWRVALPTRTCGLVPRVPTADEVARLRRAHGGMR